jgi:hypothetical protein
MNREENEIIGILLTCQIGTSEKPCRPQVSAKAAITTQHRLGTLFAPVLLTLEI